MTPYYVIDEARLRSNLSLIRDVSRRADVEIIVAFKAFANWKLFPIIREYVEGCTASSLYEARLAVEEFKARPHVYSPAYTDEIFSFFAEHATHITFNSLSQYARFRDAGKGVSYGLRINPQFSEVETELYNPCAPGTRFGIIATDMPDELPREIEGFHCHTLCESSSYDLEKVLTHIEQRFGKWLPQLRWLNLGGGHLMTRDTYDIEHLIGLLTNFKRKYPELHIILEPGAAFVWRTGELVASVVDIVENAGIRTAILDMSFTCHTPDCLEMPYQPDIIGARKGTHGENVYRLGGNSCLSGDYLGLWSFDHALQLGERLTFEDMIHYTTVKTTMFNGIHHPSILLRHTDGTEETLREYNYEDYRARMD